MLTRQKTRAAVRSLGLWLLAMLLGAVGAQAQAPAWQMAISAGLPNNSSTPVRGMATDASGNVYIVGSFIGTTRFGTISLTSAGSTDGYVAKWNPVAQAFAWVRQMGGPGTDAAVAVAVSGTSVYVVGDTDSNTPVFGNIMLSGAGNTDGFVTRLTDAGPATAFDWARLVGDLGADGLVAVAVQGNAVYIGGQFSSTTLALDGIGLSNTFGSVNTPDGLVARLTDTGPAASFAWARTISGTGQENVRVLAVAGPVLYVGGFFTSNPGAVGNANLTTAGGRDAFVVKYTDSGTAPVQGWVQTAGGPGFEGINGMAVVGNNVYIAGYMTSGTTVFGAFSLSNAGGSNGTNDIFVAKLTDNGPTSTFAWAQQAGSPNSDNALALIARGTRLYVAGSLGFGLATFGPVSLSNPAFNSNVVVARLDDLGSSGRYVWAQQGGGSGSDIGFAMAVVPTGTVFVAGLAVPPATFGAFTLTNPTTSSMGFLASLDDGPLAVAAAQAVGGFSLFPNPARGSVTVHLPAVPVPAILTLLDALGRPVRRQTTAPAAAGTGVPFDVMGLAAGVYALRVQAGGYTATQKLVVE